MPPAIDGAAADAVGSDTVPLCRLYRGGAGHNARIVLYRRAVEARASAGAELAALVQDLITERVAGPARRRAGRAIDPDFGLDWRPDGFDQHSFAGRPRGEGLT